MRIRGIIISAVLSAILTWFAWSFTELTGAASASDFWSWAASWLVFTILFYGVGGAIADLYKDVNTPRSRDDQRDDHDDKSQQH